MSESKVRIVVKGEKKEEEKKIVTSNDSQIISLLEKRYKCEKCNISFHWNCIYQTHLLTDKHNMTEEELSMHKSNTAKINRIKGDNAEIEIVKILDLLDFENVIHYGFTMCKYDVFVKYKDEIFLRAIQIKTLSKNECGTYKIFLESEKYTKDTLIIGINLEENIYSLYFLYETSNTSMITFQPYDVHLFYDLDKFKKKVFELAKLSQIVENMDDFCPIKMRIESESIARFNSECDELKICFQRYNIVSSPIDGIANNYNIQFKSSSDKVATLYNFNLFRHTDKQFKPYSLNDNLNFFIFEILDILYKGFFYIIPISILIKGGYISDMDYKGGKHSISLAPPDYPEWHWSLQFINKFDFLNSNINIDIETIFFNKYFNNFFRECTKKKIQCELDKNNTITTLNSHKVRLIKNDQYQDSSSKFILLEIFKYLDTKIRIESNYKFFIFVYGEKYPDDCCIVPARIMIERGYVRTSYQPGNSTISLKYPDCKDEFWSKNYINNFDILRIDNNENDIPPIVNPNVTIHIDKDENTVIRNLNNIGNTNRNLIKLDKYEEEVYLSLNPYCQFYNYCLWKGYNCKIGKRDKIEYVNGYKVKLLPTGVLKKFTCDFKLREHRNDKSYRISINDGYEFIILCFGGSFPGYFCIVPIDIMIKRGYIETKTCEGKHSVTLEYPNTLEGIWSNQYVNNFDLLKPHTIIKIKTK